MPITIHALGRGMLKGAHAIILSTAMICGLCGSYYLYSLVWSSTLNTEKKISGTSNV